MMSLSASILEAFFIFSITLCYNERQRKERKYFKKQAAAGAAV